MRISDWSSDVCSSDLLDGQRVVGELAAHEGAEALQPAGKKLAFGRRQAQQPALAVAEGETDRRMRHGEARERVLHVASLGAGGFPELEARRSPKEQGEIKRTSGREGKGGVGRGD